MELNWLGPYQLVRKLGRGGMGVVYEGVDVETGQRAALKVLSEALSEEEDFRTRFETEIETLRRLKHPNIVRLFGFGRQEGLLFYAMELVDGPSLDGELRRGRRFGWPEVVQIGLQICRGLRHAHDRGVIHRDLKPGNLLLASDGTVKLADFGIAQLFGRTRVTAVGSVVGTLDYMAPEQAQGNLVDARADLYSLGAVLYALLSGRPPLRAKTLADMLEKLQSHKPEPIRQLAPEVPEALETLLDQLLEKSPDRRIATALMAARRFEAVLQEHEGMAPVSLPDTKNPEHLRCEEPPRVAEAQIDPAEGRRKESSSAPEPSERSQKPLEIGSLEAEGEVRALPETQPMTPPPSPRPSSGVPSAGKPGEGASVWDAEPATMPSVGVCSSASGGSEEVEDASASLLEPTQQATPPVAAASNSPKEKAALGSACAPPTRKARPNWSAADAASENASHFTVVSEEELDQMPREEPSQPWISWQTWVLAASLLAVGGTVWYLLQPPSADALYERITQSAQEGTIEALRTVESAIQEFLARYPSDPRAEQIRQFDRELDLDRLERRFELQASGRLRIHTPLSPVERAYAEAVALSRTNPDLGIVKLQALLDLYENRPDRSGPTGACLELARRRLEKLRQQVQEHSAGSLQLLKQRLLRAEELDKISPDKAQAIRHAIIELYGDKPWAASVVAQAKTALANSQPTQTPHPETPPAKK